MYQRYGAKIVQIMAVYVAELTCYIPHTTVICTYREGQKALRGKAETAMKLKGQFVRKPIDRKEWEHWRTASTLAPIEVVATELVEKAEYDRILDDLLADNDLMAKYAEETLYYDDAYHCLLIRVQGQREALAVCGEGYAYARYAAIVEAD